MTDAAPPTSTTAAAPSPAPAPAAASTSAASATKTAAPKRKSKARRKARRRDGSDSDASSDGNASDSAAAPAASKPAPAPAANAKGKAKQKPLFPESSHTTPLVWADADVSQNEIVSFDFGDSSKSTKLGKPQRELTEEQRKRHEEKLRLKKEKQKAKRRAAKEAKAKEREKAAAATAKEPVKANKPTPTTTDAPVKPNAAPKSHVAPKPDASPKDPQTSKEVESLTASTSALKLDDPAPSPAPAPTFASAVAASTSPPTAAAPTTTPSTAVATTNGTPAVRPQQPFGPHRPLRERLSNPNENRFGPRPPQWANDQRQPVRPMPDFWRGRGGPRGIPRGAFRGFPRGRGRGGFGPFGPGGPHFRPPFRPPGPPHGPPNAVNAAVANNGSNAPPANAPSAPRAMIEPASGSGSAATPASALTSEQPETSASVKPTESTDGTPSTQQQQQQQQTAASQPVAQQSVQQPAVTPHQPRFRPNLPRPDGRWGHDGFHQHMREDAFRANRGMRARGRGRGFAPRGGFRPFFNHPGHLPTPEVSPDRAEKPSTSASTATPAKPAESASIEALLDDSGAVTVRLPGETEAVAVAAETRPPSQPDLSSQSPHPPAFTSSNPSPGPYSDAGSMSSSGYVGPIPAEYYAGVPFRPPPVYGRSFGHGQTFTPEPFQPGHASHPSHASRGSFSGPGGFFSQSPLDPRAGSPFNPYAAGFVMPAVGMKADTMGMMEEPKSPLSEGTDSMRGQIQTPEGFVGMAPAPGYYAYNPYADGGVFYPPPQGYWPQQYEQGMYGYEGEFQPHQGHGHPGY